MIYNGTANVKAYGNIMSLVDEENFATATALTENRAFYGLFYSNSKLTDASGLLLPATTLTEYCYGYMFQTCNNLTAALALPATTLAGSCYKSMFYQCTNLTAAPALPATALAENCYYNMFYNCAGLTTAPELPAETLVENCYGNMFYNCSNLNSVTCLATDISATGCTSDWLWNVAASGIFTAQSDTVGWQTNSPHGIPTGWTRENRSVSEIYELR